MTENRPTDDSLLDDPLTLLREWIGDAESELAHENPTAMALATVTPEGIPDARMVICRGFDFERGWLVFYTDLRSTKGRQLRECPRASAIFHWNSLQRQIRLEGPVTLAPNPQSDAYFAKRPAGSQAAAWASHQSQPLESRAVLEKLYLQQKSRFGVTDPDRPAAIPRPEYWGGYRIWIETIEFWTGMQNRLHDRAAYRRELEPASADADGGECFMGFEWSASRLSP